MKLTICRTSNITLAILWMTGMVLGSGFCAYARPRHPEAVGGVLDLRQWNFSHDGIVTLSGEWELYWKHLYTGTEPELGTTFRPDGMLDVPGSWHAFTLSGESPVGPYGYATLRLRVLLPQNLSTHLINGSVTCWL
jgi:two-component system, sensor histidine kinase ChiS